MKKTQIDASLAASRKILGGIMIPVPRSGWYTVWYDGDTLDEYSIVQCKRNPNGELDVFDEE